MAEQPNSGKSVKIELRRFLRVSDRRLTRRSLLKFTWIDLQPRQNKTAPPTCDNII